jgi:hypothetical protein
MTIVRGDGPRRQCILDGDDLTARSENAAAFS